MGQFRSGVEVLEGLKTGSKSGCWIIGSLWQWSTCRGAGVVFLVFLVFLVFGTVITI